jgi:murein DD-endopeptidase MepM/ murein hydrolase activator NlpD
LVCVALAGIGANADAKRIYSYRDDSGVVHFSDRAPNDARTEVSEQLIEVDPKRMVYLREDGPDDDRRFSLWNGYGGPIEVLMDFAEAVNIVSEPPLPGVRVIPPQQNSLILQVQPIDDRRAWSYRLSYRYVHGDPSARHDPDAVYLLPFDERLSLRVDQAFGGKYSHAEDHSRHAVDISMDEGTPVRAARAGVVMSVESDFHGAGTDIARFGDRANHIRIVHSDGTMAVYAHLELESVIVGIGDRVRAGEVIAKSGNTGFSTGPHLHFVIQRNQGGTLVSVPFQFTVNGKRVTPEFGMRLGGQ